MSDLASELRRYADRAPAITLDEVSRARVPRPRRRRTLVAAAVCGCVAATAIAVVATRNPDRHRVNVVDAPDSSAPGGVTSTSTGTGESTPLVTGTIEFKSPLTRRVVKPGVKLPLGVLAEVAATIWNNSDRPLALVHNEVPVYGFTCDHDGLEQDPNAGIMNGVRPFSSTYTSLPLTAEDEAASGNVSPPVTYDGPGLVDITPPVPAGQSVSTFDDVTGRVVGTMTCTIVVRGPDGWRPLASAPTASIEVVPATTATTAITATTATP